MVSSNITKAMTNYTYDTLGNLVIEKVKNKGVDYQYNELNQLVKKTDTQNQTFAYSYDKRGNRIAETGKKASREFVYDATNRMVAGTNWKGDESAYTYNGLGLRINNTHTTHAGKVYDRDYVIDYTSPENDDLYVYAMGNGQLEYEQKHVYAGSERIEQFTDKGNWERTLYVHEDVMGNTRYYTKATGQNFAELEYDAWGLPVSPNKLVNNDHGNYVFATFTGHIYDTVLDVYFAEARFYDAANRQWLAMDPIKSGLNWYQYCASNPTTSWDPTGLVAEKANPNQYNNPLTESENNNSWPDIEVVYSPENYFNTPANIATITTAGVDLTGNYLISDFVKWTYTNVRPANIGAGVYAKEMVAFRGQLGAASNALKTSTYVLGGLTVVLDVGLGVADNVSQGAPTSKIISDATVDTALDGLTLGASIAASTAAGLAAGSVVPDFGNVVGAGVGLVVGVVGYITTDMIKVDGQTLRQTAKKELYSWIESW